ncbi:P-II family nitrogen regulator [Desulfoglaeba alkanexedens]|uniref:P-II family nitrogen regulator n=1 Tax=Desulfoglaeba alkanexedens ALDC TaxID=980445 RepID=A0A4P8L2F4_9BACT|nr:P-II family nitrogen regulator [Desulfoglaeba alkanexedens]QCQ21990.1 P-II family nitrogen regulator [Desulfoglaeba alkanexedens ALDC]
MKMIVAILRPDRLKGVEDRLKEAGFPSLTEFSVRGRGRQKGITIGDMHYEKLPKSCLLIAAKDGDVKTITGIVTDAGKTGHIGDGKIFVIDVEEAIRIRTGEQGEATL